MIAIIRFLIVNTRNWVSEFILGFGVFFNWKRSKKKRRNNEEHEKTKEREGKVNKSFFYFYFFFEILRFFSIFDV